MPILVRGVVVLLAVGVVASCVDTTAPPEPCLDDSAVELFVAGGASPRFTWSPSCLAYSLGVSNFTDSVGTIIWQIDADSANTLASGITYGDVPAGAHEVVAPVPLVVGQRYAVGLFRTASDTVPFDPRELAVTSFTR